MPPNRSKIRLMARKIQRCVDNHVASSQSEKRGAAQNDTSGCKIRPIYLEIPGFALVMEKEKNQWHKQYIYIFRTHGPNELSGLDNPTAAIL